MNSTTSFRVARIRGVPIRIHVTVLLVAIDLTDASTRVAALALTLLPPEVCTLRIVHPFHVAFEGWLGADSLAQYRREHSDHATAAAKSIIAPYAASGIECRLLVCEGDPRVVILREAVRDRCDLIVLATHARTWLSASGGHGSIRSSRSPSRLHTDVRRTVRTSMLRFGREVGRVSAAARHHLVGGARGASGSWGEMAEVVILTVASLVLWVEELRKLIARRRVRLPALEVVHNE